MNAGHVTIIGIAACLVAGPRAASACMDEDLLYLEGTPEWNDASTRFGWFCDEKDNPYRTCRKPGTEPSGILPAGAEAFLERNTLRFEEDYVDYTDANGDWTAVRYTCRVVMGSKVDEGLPELTVLTLRSGKLETLVDSTCEGRISPDGTLMGIAWGWTDDVELTYRARVLTLEQLEALYWEALGRDVMDTEREDASLYFQHALALDPSMTMARYMVARLAAITGDGETALVQLVQAVSMSPQKIRALVKKDEAFWILAHDPSFKHLMLGNHGWKKVQAEIGTPEPDALPPV